MGKLVLIIVVGAAALTISSGIWVAVELIKALSATRGGGDAPHQPDNQSED